MELSLKELLTIILVSKEVQKMEIKFKRKIEDYEYLLCFDLSKHKSGWALLRIKPFAILDRGVIKVRRETDMPWDQYYHQILDIFNTIKNKHGDSFFTIKEQCPQQAGKRSSVAALQELAKAHAIFDLASVHAGVDVYDYTGVHSVAVRSLFKKKLQNTQSPSKEEINGYLRAAYQGAEVDPQELDISDAIAVGITLIERKWNTDIIAEMKEKKKNIKELRSERAKELLQNYLTEIGSLIYEGG